MATKSPGIYFSETDNTQFTNPKAVSGTVLALVGYAKKGPINIPTEINSWRDFTTTFGKPVEGKYSGLAVKNFLSTGGSVLFTRIADGTASTSNYIVKNGEPEVFGKVSFTRTEDILPEEEIYGKGDNIYSFKMKKLEDDLSWKYFFIRSPGENRRLTQASIAEQIERQMGKTPATFEGKIKPNVEEKLYGFNITDKDEKVFDNDFYIDIKDGTSEELVAQYMKIAIETGTNSIVELALEDVDPNLDYGTKFTQESMRCFYISISNNDRLIKIDFPKENLPLDRLANIIDQSIKDIYNIRCFSCPGDNDATANKLIFVNNSKGSDIKIKTLTSEEEQKGNKNLFANDLEVLELKDKIVIKKNTSVARVETSNPPFDINYDSVTKSVIFTSNDTGKQQSIKIVNSKYKSPEEPVLGGLFKETIAIKGQEDIDISISRNVATDKKITFTNNQEFTAPIIEKVAEDPFGEDDDTYGKHFKELLNLEREKGDETGDGLDDPIKGHKEIFDSERDMIVFTSKEKGSGTNNISIEVFTTVNPINAEDIKHNIIIYVDGSIKEKYEDISLNPKDENYFHRIINESPENGGSEYINITVIKKDLGEPEVELKDGMYYIGKSNKEGDKEKPSNTPISDYGDYNYMIGADGIPEADGYRLFEDAMEPGVSALANKELYDFHILICPDDRSEAVQSAQIKLCEDRGDAITIIDPPQQLDKKDVIAWHNGKGAGRSIALDSNYATTYWPWCKVFDTSSGTGKYAWVMPSIIMAAQYVKVDRSSGCHIAPAGEVNGILPVIDIERYPNILDRDELYTDYNRINPITKFKDGTIVAYGEKTTQRTNSVLTKIHTRRMLIQIKKQCREALRGYIFMPNTVDYLSKISNNVTAILEGYKAKGGLSFYKVICDETNNPTEVRQQDIINVDVIIVPEGTIEQINISLTLNKTAETITDK